VKIYIISNPISGRPGSRPALLQRMQAELSAAGFEVQLGLTAGPRHAIDLARAAPADTAAVVSVGGDGTLREVAHGLEGRGIPLIPFPMGTENVLAKYFGHQADCGQLVQTLSRREVLDYDVGVCGEHRFLLMIGVGFDADVVRRVAEARRGHLSYASYFRPGWQAFWRYGFPHIAVEVDGKMAYAGRGLAWAGVIPRYSLGTRILHKACVDDGLLDVCIVPCASKAKLLACAARLLLRRPLANHETTYMQCRSVRFAAVGGAEVHVQFDGDYAGTLPVECSVRQAGMKLMIPPPANQGVARTPGGPPE
jgi:diacylglycerol kinase family enzyme